MNTSTKLEAPTPIHSWVVSDNVSPWLPLKMRTRPLRIRRITWPVSKEWKRLHFWNPRPPFVYSLYNFYWAPTTIKGGLLSSRPMLKPFSGKKIPSPVEMGPKNGGFGENGVQTLDIGFATPQKALSCAEPRRLTYFVSKSVCASRLYSLSQEPKNSRVTLCRGARNHACAEPKPLNRFGWNFALW